LLLNGVDGTISGCCLHDINDSWRLLTLSAICWLNCGVVVR
jgi:hypothetical protein